MHPPDQNKRPLWLNITLLIAIVAVVMGYNFDVFTTNNSIEYVDASSDEAEVSLNGQLVEQHFFANEPVRSVELVIFQEPETNVNEVSLQATLINFDSDEIYGPIEQTVKLADGAARVRFEFPDTLTQENNEFGIQLSMPGQNKPVYLKATEKGYAEKLYVNDVVVDDLRLLFKVSYTNNLLLSFFALTLVLLTLSVFFLMFPKIGALKPNQLFIILALVSGIALTFISPSGQEPDVGDHILRSFDVSYGNVSPIFRQTYDKNIQMPTNFSQFDDRVLDPGLNKGLARVRKLQNTYFATGDSGVQDYRYKANYAAVTYWPQGFGLYLGRVLGWNAYDMINLARLLNLLVYVFLTQQAIKRLPTLKNTLLVIALMPASLFQASSLSPDATINGLCFLFVALVIQLAIEKPRVRLLDFLPSILSLYFVVLAKPVYVILALLYCVIPLRKLHPRFTTAFRYGVLVGGASVAAALIFGFSAGWLDLAENNPVYDSQMSFVMNNLATTVRILFHTLDVNSFQYLSWLNMLGWLNYSLGILIIAVPLYIVLVGLAEVQPFDWAPWQRYVLWAVFVLSVAGIFVGLYVFDVVNSIGARLMLGAQGRYFIPLFLLPFLALKRPFSFNRPALISPKLAGISGLMLTYTLYTLTRLIY